MLKDEQNFYMTTAIAYASKKPHVGNTYEIILADAIARFKRLQKFNVFFCTGTDEHGQKIEQVSKKMGVSPTDHVNTISGEIKTLWDLINCSYDIFIRTTNADHKKNVQKIFNKLYNQGDIYKHRYEGFYCIACEAFLTNSQISDGRCGFCGQKITESSEEAYFFKATNYQNKLLEYFNKHPNFIQPNFFCDEIVNGFLKTGINDFCVSRRNFKWGIPIEFDPDYVIYVWFDALINYLSALNFDVDNYEKLKFKQFWPVNLQIVGKDILRFHATIWPMMLMALNLPLPSQLLVHQHVLCKDKKMSKTEGNVIYVDDLITLFSLDAVRFYLLRIMNTSHDGIISYENLIDIYNLELANNFGNLVKRVCDMIYKYFNGEVHFPENKDEIDIKLKNKCEETVSKYLNLMNEYKINEAIAVILDLSRFCNKFIDSSAPWTLAKNDSLKFKLNNILFNAVEAIRFIAIMFQPVMPKSSLKILNQLGIESVDLDSLNSFGDQFKTIKIKKSEVIFDRIDKDKKLNEIKIYNKGV